MILEAVEPFDQVFPEAWEEVSVTEPPEQKVVDPLVVTTGVAGTGFTVTKTLVEGETHPFASV
mgnify:CR=1 FL=1